MLKVNLEGSIKWNGSDLDKIGEGFHLYSTSSKGPFLCTLEREFYSEVGSEINFRVSHEVDQKGQIVKVELGVNCTGSYLSTMCHSGRFKIGRENVECMTINTSENYWENSSGVTVTPPSLNGKKIDNENTIRNLVKMMNSPVLDESIIKEILGRDYIVIRN